MYPQTALPARPRNTKNVCRTADLFPAVSDTRPVSPDDLRSAIQAAQRALALAERVAEQLCARHPRRYENIVGGIDAARDVLRVSSKRWLTGSAS